jgi:putative FmdB family regulatory protein
MCLLGDLADGSLAKEGRSEVSRSLGLAQGLDFDCGGPQSPRPTALSRLSSHRPVFCHGGQTHREIRSLGSAASPRPWWGSIFPSAASRQASRSVPAGRQQGGPNMPHYEFYCERCKREVALTLSIGERERGDYKCPGCGGKKLQPLLGTFFSQTSRKA